MMPSPTTTSKSFTPTTVAAASQDQQSSAAAAVKCPRCDSPNTKFCYYNNYSLSQPRHFCKTCRRYWTKGGALRNVPVGGGCRKSKKSKSSSTSSSSSTTTTFQLGIGGATHNQFIGFNYPIIGDPMFNGQSNNIASSIESLSSMNQDLHWKLQQQRLAMLFGTTTASATATATALMEPISFHHLHPVMEGPMKSGDGGTTAWFLESSSGSSSSNTTCATIGAPMVNHNNNGSEHQWGLTNWGDMQQFSALP